MSEHFHCMKSVISKPFDKVNQFYKSKLFQIYQIRYSVVTINKQETNITRVFIKARDSGQLKQVGWVLDECVNACMICYKDFTFLVRRHHCRACGIIACPLCCHRIAFLEGCIHLGGHLICNNCEPLQIDEEESAVGYVALVDTLTNWGELLVRDTKFDPFFHDHQSHRSKDGYGSSQVTNNDIDRNPSALSIIPLEGFVIKIFRKDNEQKAFINVFHHPSITDDKLLLCYDPFNDNAQVHSHHQQQQHRINKKQDIIYLFPIIYYSRKDSTIIDKNHNQVKVYNVLVSSSYFKPEVIVKQKTKVADNSSLNKIIQIINQKYSVSSSSTQQSSSKSPPSSSSPPPSPTSASLLYYEDRFILPKIKAGYTGFSTLTYMDFDKSIYKVKCMNPNKLYIAKRSSINQSTIASDADDQKSTGSSSSSSFAPNRIIQSVAVTKTILNNKINHITSNTSNFFHNLHFNNGLIINDGPVSKGKDATTDGDVKKDDDGDDNGNSKVAVANTTSNVESNVNSDMDDQSDVMSVITTTSLASSINSPHSSSLSYIRLNRNYSIYKSTLSVTNFKYVKSNQLLQPAMLLVKYDELLAKGDDAELKLKSMENPNVLLGYQILIPYDSANEENIRNCTAIDKEFIYIIVDTAKNNLRKTEFKLVNLTEKEPLWVRLKRGLKRGIEFRLMRHVITIDVDYSTKSAKSDDVK